MWGWRGGAHEPMLCGVKRPVPVQLLFVAGFVLMAAFALRAPWHLGGDAADAFAMQWLYSGIAVVVAAQCFWRAAAHRDERAIWVLVGGGMLCGVIGNEVYDVLYAQSDAPPVPSWADAAWLV